MAMDLPTLRKLVALDENDPLSRFALGRKLNVTGTPTMFFTNGKRVPGAIGIQELEKLLTENS